MNVQDRFYILHSAQEWEILETMAKEQGHEDYRTYLNVQLHKMTSNISGSSCKECCCFKKQIAFTIPPHIKDQLEGIADVHCSSPGLMSKLYISNPLLAKYYMEKGF